MSVRPGPYLLYVYNGLVTSISYPASDVKPRDNWYRFQEGGFLIVSVAGPALREHSFGRAEQLIAGVRQYHPTVTAKLYVLGKCSKCGDELHVEPTAPLDDPLQSLCITCGHGPLERQPSPMIKNSKRTTKSKKHDPVFDVASGMKSEATPDPTALIERARFREKLPCVMNELIADAAGKELAVIIVERDAWLERRKAENSKAREKRAHYDERILELGKQLESRTELKEVDCIEYLDPVKKEILVKRRDNGETVVRRPAEEEDLQETLLDGTGKPIVEPGKKKKGAKEIEPPFGAPVANAAQVDSLLEGLGEP